ncbi:Predicted phosphohydrolase, MPP superfamily [Sinosporangium album]|uniref:Predicted phosphohydrolase, MPP superfamily n=1 Tax=Sinosporangium album TaxID=504805 RepID=A0A1G8H1H2_9ACTN|nr:metallophosphoesterase [Sinosporangium album]SDI00419.1 Predicted phosphohydrolase, MPP superfamily [Sinosporangium album]
MDFTHLRSLVRSGATGTAALLRRAGGTVVVKTLLIVVVALAGAWLALSVGASVRTPVGPAEIGMSLQPATRGETVVDVHPLGKLLFDTHDAPVRLRITLENIDQDQAKSMIEDPRLADRLPGIIEENLGVGLRALALQAALWSLAGAVLAALVVFRRLWAVLTGFVATLVAIAAIGVGVFVTFRPESVVEPRYTGLIAGAPSLVGSAESIVTRFESYRLQLAKLVTNVSKLYDTVSALPVYDADPATIRVLHISDIHLNPIAWSLVRSITGQFKIDVIVDTGDLTDHGTRAEDKFVEEIGKLDVPYVFVRGNHDSKATERAVAKQKNAIVLDGKSAVVGGLKIYGLGDPRFTPDKSVVVDTRLEWLHELGRTHAVRSAADKADLVAVHDPTVGRGFSGTVPMVLAGHAHRRSTEVLPTGTRVLVQGSTGGAGLRALEHEEPTPVQASVLYFNQETRRLQAWDDITLGGLGEQWVQIQRHVESQPARTISQEPTQSPSPAGKASGAATPPKGKPLWHQGQTSPMLQRSPTEDVTEQESLS